MSEVRPKVAFKNWQWGEVLALSVVTVAYLAVRLYTQSELLAIALGIFHLALLAHIATWIIPLVRSRSRAKRD